MRWCQLSYSKSYHIVIPDNSPLLVPEGLQVEPPIDEVTVPQCQSMMNNRALYQVIHRQNLHHPFGPNQTATNTPLLRCASHIPGNSQPLSPPLMLAVLLNKTSIWPQQITLL